MVLVGAGHLGPAAPSSEPTRDRCRALNRLLTERALDQADATPLASPVLGAAVHVPHMQQLFMQCLRSGLDTPSEMALGLQRTLAARGQGLTRDGRTMAQADAVPLLERLAQEFMTNDAPVLAALGIGVEMASPAAPG